MIQRLTKFLESKGYTLEEQADCYRITSPMGRVRIANLRWKTKPVWGRNACRWEWSIPLVDWQRYQGWVDVLFVLEKSTGYVHAAELKHVQPMARIYNGDDLDKGGSVFLPVDGYKKVAKLAK